MNAKQVKRIRKHVRITFPYMPDETLYEFDIFGCIVVSPMCKRAFVRDIKKNMKKARRDS